MKGWRVTREFKVARYELTDRAMVNVDFTTRNSYLASLTLENDGIGQFTRVIREAEDRRLVSWML